MHTFWFKAKVKNRGKAYKNVQLNLHKTVLQSNIWVPY